MKEILNQKLANPSQPPYARGGDIFMAENGGGKDMFPNSQPTNPEHVEKIPQAPKSGVEKPVSAERQAAARKSWEESNKGRVLPVDERRTIDELVRRGLPPIAGGTQEPRQEQPTAGDASGGGGGGGEKPPAPPTTPPEEPNEGQASGAGGADRLNIDDYNDPRLQNIVSELNQEVDRVGAGRPLDPRFIQGQLERVRNLVDAQQVNGQEGVRLLMELNGWMNEALQARGETQGSRYGVFGQRELTEVEKTNIRTGKEQETDRIFNRMFDRVDENPKEDFNAAFGSPGQYEYEEFMRTLREVENDTGLELPRREAARRLVVRYAEERKVREITHNVNYAVLAGVGTQKLVEFVQGFQSSQADLAFSKKGVVSAFHFYEQALLRVREENGGYIPEFEVVGDPKEGRMGRVEDLARKYLNATPIGKKMESWEKERAISLARGMGIITGRFIEIAASSILPESPGDRVAGRFTSLYAQDIIRDIAPFRHLIYKFNIGKERNRIFAFLLNRRKGPWNKQELADWDWDKRIDVINGLMSDKEERFLSTLNPFRIGGIFSRTTWRVGDNPIASALSAFKGKEWIGTGVRIELMRSALQRGDKDAEMEVRNSLRKIATILPLKIFFNIKEAQANVLDNMDIKNEQLQQDLDQLVVLQEIAVQNRLAELPFENIEEEVDRNRVRMLADRIKEQFIGADGKDTPVMDRFVDRLREKEWTQPFNFGTEDVPFDQYEFGRTGGTSIARRWRDIGSEKTSVDATLELITHMDTFKKPEDIIAVMRKIYTGIAGYDEDLAREVTLKIAEGVIRFYSKDWFARLPFGIGTLVGLMTGKASYAQVAFGRTAMAWDELNINEFTRILRGNNMLSVAQQHQLQGRAGGSGKEAAVDFTRSFLPLIMLALAYYMITQVAKEKS